MTLGSSTRGTLRQSCPLSRVFRFSKPLVESRRADSNR